MPCPSARYFTIKINKSSTETDKSNPSRDEGVASSTTTSPQASDPDPNQPNIGAYQSTSLDEHTHSDENISTPRAGQSPNRDISPTLGASNTTLGEQEKLAREESTEEFGTSTTPPASLLKEYRTADDEEGSTPRASQSKGKGKGKGKARVESTGSVEPLDTSISEEEQLRRDSAWHSRPGSISTALSTSATTCFSTIPTRTAPVSSVPAFAHPPPLPIILHSPPQIPHNPILNPNWASDTFAKTNPTAIPLASTLEEKMNQWRCANIGCEALNASDAERCVACGWIVPRAVKGGVDGELVLREWGRVGEVGERRRMEVGGVAKGKVGGVEAMKSGKGKEKDKKTAGTAGEGVRRHGRVMKSKGKPDSRLLGKAKEKQFIEESKEEEEA